MQGTAADEAVIRMLPGRYVAAYNADVAAGIAALMADGYPGAPAGQPGKGSWLAVTPNRLMAIGW